MLGLDVLISKSLEITILENLGQNTYQKISQRLFERYGVGFTQAVEDFKKLDTVLKEFFGSGAEGIEKQIIGKIIVLEKSRQNEKKWFTIKNESLTKIILESLGDEDKKNIINALIGEPKIVSEILDLTNIPQTSGYRKINSLIQNGILIPQGFAIAHDGKKVIKYGSVFENISVSLEKNKVIVKVQPTLESVDSSHIVQMVCT